ncbi:MAG: hypothetical protein UV53_C0003G0013 [Candidatus Azambacteria bacterium GW2011_GWE1_42_9]|nr:MAG: hypothetical protein UV53_C0003G0013 [Candidatus Azambacteria bacterium GW2011_GWE1_42_9]
MEDRTEQLRKIKDEIINAKNSPLYDFRIKNKFLPVIGEGNHYAKIMFIGEAPGKNEALTGRPFCGAAGKILDELLLSADIARNEVYVTNIVKDRPPFNRDPEPQEIEFYAPFLDRQIEIIKPEVIATLGRFSMDYIMKKFGLESEIKSISQIHGKMFVVPVPILPFVETQGQAEKLDEASKTSSTSAPRQIIPLYHPAIVIYNAREKETLKKDFEILKQFAK